VQDGEAGSDASQQASDAMSEDPNFTDLSHEVVQLAEISGGSGRRTGSPSPS
jgi:hypothetical protein